MTTKSDPPIIGSYVPESGTFAGMGLKVCAKCGCLTGDHCSREEYEADVRAGATAGVIGCVICNDQGKSCPGCFCLECGVPIDPERSSINCLVCELDKAASAVDPDCELCEQERELEPGSFTPHRHAGGNT